MGAGAFNVTQLIAELGLQKISGSEMRVLQTIQPTMNVGDLDQVTPPHQAPTELFGVSALTGVGTFATVGIQSLGAGGCFIDWWSINPAVGGVLMKVVDANPGFTVGPTASVGLLSRDPVASLLFNESIALFSGTRVALGTVQQLWNVPVPMFIPRGSFFTLQSSTITTGLFECGIHVRDVPASEFSPS